MELKMPMREIRDKYTKSEIFLMGWHSAEQAYNMRTNSESKAQANDASGRADTSRMLDHMSPTNVTERVLEERLGPEIISKMVDEKGNMDLRKLTGPQALHFMRSMGISIAPRMVI